MGYGSAVGSEETTEASRRELWLPIWDSAATLPEIVQLFGEGRAQFGRRQARNAVEFALAVNLLGLDRGVTSFVRYGFLKRNGLAFLATPLGRIRVEPHPQARLLADPALTSWLDRLRSACRDKSKTPARYDSALKGIDRALFGFAVRSQTDEASDASALRGVMAALGRAEETLSRGVKFCSEKSIRPLQGLSPRWLEVGQGDGPGCVEFRLAASLASIPPAKGGRIGPFRSHMEPVESKGRRVKWSPGGHSAVWSDRPLVENLSAAFLRRWMEAERAGAEGGLDPFAEERESNTEKADETRNRARRDQKRPVVTASLADVVTFLRGGTDDELLSDLLWGLIGLKSGGRPWKAPRCLVPAPFALLRLVVHRVALDATGPDGDEKHWTVAASRNGAKATTPTAFPFHLLAKGDLPGAINSAEHRLASDGLVPFGWRNRQRRRASVASEQGLDPARLLAACLFPLSASSLTSLARKALAPPEPLDLTPPQPRSAPCPSISPPWPESLESSSKCP